MSKTLLRTMCQLLVIIASGIFAGYLPSICPDVIQVTAVQHILLVIFVMGALTWLLEPIPVFATSLVIIASICLLISDASLLPIRNALNEVDSTHIISYKSVLACFSSPIIILFLGGFALAIACSKYKIDIQCAQIMLKPFGKKPKSVMLGLMLITAFFGMFMSNTATTVMMLSMVAPIFAVIEKNDPGLKALVLCVPFAANIGGMGTPIGTPPNAIAVSYLSGSNTIGFLDWMIVAVPVATLCLFICWFVLCKLFPFRNQSIHLHITDTPVRNWQTYTVLGVFILTLLLWFTEKLHGINCNVVALLPIVIFTATGILSAKDIGSMNWDVIWLVAGGLALGEALSVTGLASTLAHAVDYQSFGTLAVIIIIGGISWVISNFISATATANLMIPIAFAIFSTLDTTNLDMGMILMFVAMTISCGMALPISTPPNALAYATGYIKNREMLLSGGIMSAVCLLVLITVMCIFYMF